MLWWRKAAEAGDTPAMNRLGLAYANGFGVAKDPGEGAELVPQGRGGRRDPGDEQYRPCLYGRRGGGERRREATRWFRKAAEAGNAVGMNHLGFAYERARRRGDPAEAVRWYQKAAEAGNVYAMNNLGLAYRNGVGVPKNEEEAERWLAKARQ